MKLYHPKTIKEAINHFQDFLECDLYSKFRPTKRLGKEYWTREDTFKNEKEFIQYIREHFDILRKQIRRIK
jgi:uncharacterized coiled-coil DUF342 family protein